MTSFTRVDGRARIGALLPQHDLGTDPGAIRAFAQGVEELGYSHLLCYEHVLGASVANRPDWTGPYDDSHPFHEPFVLYAFMAGATSTLGFVTGVMVLPQRQTALVAKQAAELAIVSGGRFRLGVGIGWNEVEFESLGVPFAARAARYEEQLTTLRRLWTEPVVDVDGRFHRIPEAGIDPLPTTSVPLWLGTGYAEPAIDRVARLADGWIPSLRNSADAKPALDALKRACEVHDRPLDTMGIEARIVLADLPRAEWAQQIDSWRSAGASHISVATGRMGFETVDAHLGFLAEFAAEHVPPTPAPRESD